MEEFERWIIVSLYNAIVQDFSLEDELSLEVFEIQYWNRFNGDEGEIWRAVEADYL